MRRWKPYKLLALIFLPSLLWFVATYIEMKHCCFLQLSSKRKTKSDRYFGFENDELETITEHIQKKISPAKNVSGQKFTEGIAKLPLGIIYSNNLLHPNIGNNDMLNLLIKGGSQRPRFAVLVLSCNRVTVSRCLNRLLKFRPSKEQFPVIVSQDCPHEPTTEVILSYGDEVYLIKQPDQRDFEVPVKEKKLKGYFRISRHYGWALNQTFFKFGSDFSIIVEDDLEISNDFFEYFLATSFLLRDDPSLWCISAWNDNGRDPVVDDTQPQLLYRTDFFPGLGWMLTKAVWVELASKWPAAYWDDWMRKPEQSLGRACIRPEISRTKTFGKKGVSNGLFYEKYLKFTKLNEKFVDFTQIDLAYLLKDEYDYNFVKEVYNSPVTSIQDLKYFALSVNGSIRISYKTADDYKKAAKFFGLMVDFRSGMPRTAYRGIVSFFYKRRRIFLCPEVPWKGYDVTWD